MEAAVGTCLTDEMESNSYGYFSVDLVSDMADRFEL